MEEHPVNQPIHAIEIDTIPEVQGSYEVGRNGVTRIEACQKSGLHANLPYVRVWKEDVCEAEFCQHNIVGVYFGQSILEADQPAPSWPIELSADEAALAARCKGMDMLNIVRGMCTTCERAEPDCDCIPF